MTDAPAIRPPSAPVLHPAVGDAIDAAVAAHVDAMFADLRDAQETCLRTMSRFTSTMVSFDRRLERIADATAALAVRVAAMEAVLSRLKAMGPPGG